MKILRAIATILTFTSLISASAIHMNLYFLGTPQPGSFYDRSFMSF